MLKDSQHIGHSSPSSRLAFEHTSSSEQSREARLNSTKFFPEFFFSPILAMAFEADFHIVTEEKGLIR